MDFHLLQNFFPFQHISEHAIEQLSQKIQLDVRTFKKNECILSCEVHEKKIGFLLDGECAVYKTREKEDILLQNLKKNDSFGILTLFCDDEYPTLILAKKTTNVLFISKDDFLCLINANPQIAINVITFLSEKVSFLNKKIATLSGATVEEKVENYLLIQCKNNGESFPFNAAAVAGQINIGRASLYRTLRKLEENGIIELSTKKIIIKNLLYFERSTK